MKSEQFEELMTDSAEVLNTMEICAAHLAKYHQKWMALAEVIDDLAPEQKARLAAMMARIHQLGASF